MQNKKVLSYGTGRSFPCAVCGMTLVVGGLGVRSHFKMHRRRGEITQERLTELIRAEFVGHRQPKFTLSKKKGDEQDDIPKG